MQFCLRCCESETCQKGKWFKSFILPRNAVQARVRSLGLWIRGGNWRIWRASDKYIHADRIIEYTCWILIWQETQRSSRFSCTTEEKLFGGGICIKKKGICCKNCWREKFQAVWEKNQTIHCQKSTIGREEKVLNMSDV